MTTRPQSSAPEVGEQLSCTLTGSLNLHRVLTEGFTGAWINRAICVTACCIVSIQSFAETPAAVERKVAGQEVNILLPKGNLPAKVLVSLKGHIVPLNAPVSTQSHVVAKPEGNSTECKPSQSKAGSGANQHEIPLWYVFGCLIVLPAASFVIGFLVKH